MAIVESNFHVCFLCFKECSSIVFFRKNVSQRFENPLKRWPICQWIHEICFSL